MRQFAVFFGCIWLFIAVNARADFAPRPEAVVLPTGIKQYDVHLRGDGPGQTLRLVIYVPAGAHADASLPCVIVAPAGTILVVGNTIGDGDSAELLPYVTAGFAVVGYELDGDKPERATNAQLFEAVGAFMHAHGGVDDARTAVDYVLSRVPEVSRDRIYTAGHSSAATVALDVAAADKRVKACCAYAPCPDLRKRLPAKFVTAVSANVPGFNAFVDSASPVQHVAELKDKPVLLFTAEDDTNVPSPTVVAFADALRAAGSMTVTLETVKTGGHYQSMIDRGIPAGIAFLKEVDARSRP